MINYLKGTIRRLYREESRLILDVNGIGYELLLPYFVMRSIEDDGVLEGEIIEFEDMEYSVDSVYHFNRLKRAVITFSS